MIQVKNKGNAKIHFQEVKAPPLVDPPDGGWGWVVVFASLMCNIIVDGVCFSFASFNMAFQEYFGATASASALVGSLLAGCYLTVGPFVSALANKYGCRKVTIVGSVIAAVAFFLSIFSPNIQVLMITYGVLGGIGFGLIYLPSIVIIGYWFEKKRAFATGVAVCGTGLGTFIFPPLSRYLLDIYDWKGSTMIISAIVLNCAVCGALFRPVEAMTKRMKRGIVQRGSIMKALIEEKKRQRTISNGSLDNCIITKDNRLIKLERVNSNRSSLTSFFYSRPKSPLGSRSTDSKPSLAPSSNVSDKLNGTRYSHKPLSKQLLIPQVVHSLDLNTVKSGVHNIAKAKSCESLPREDPWEKLSEEGSLSTRSLSYQEVNESRMDIAESSYKPNMATPCDSRLTVNSQNNDALSIPYTSYTNSQALPPCLNGVSLVSITKYSASIQSLESIYNKNSVKLMQMFKEIIDFSLLKNCTFFLLLIASFLSMLGFFIPFIYLQPLAKAAGLTDTNATFLVSVIGVMNIVGRLLSGWLADRPWADPLHINNTALVVAGVATMLCPLCQDQMTFTIYSAFYGLCIAAFVSLRSILLVELIGLDRLTNSFGILILFQGVASMAGSPLGGFLKDITGNFKASFYMGGAMLAISGLISIPLRRLKNWQKERLYESSPEEVPINQTLKMENCDSVSVT